VPPERSDRAAFEAVFREHYDGLVRFVNRMVGSRAVAEELVHDVLLKVWIQRDRLVPGAELKGYLFRAARNHALNHLRRGKIERLWQSRQPPEEPSARPRHQRVWMQRRWPFVRRSRRFRNAAARSSCSVVNKDLSYSSIATRLEISVKTVETQMGRALKALRIALAPYRDM
jgi:RNA polymerase sigma-70 factor (ECF subfamily)